MYRYRVDERKHSQYFGEVEGTSNVVPIETYSLTSRGAAVAFE